MRRRAAEQPASPANASKKNFTGPEVSGVAVRFKQQLLDLVEGHPSFGYVEHLINDSLEEGTGDALQELRSLLTAVIKGLLHLEELIDPMHVGPTVTRDGRLLTMQVKDKAVLITDIKGFTPMTEQAKVRGKRILDILKNTYFPHLMHLLHKYQCSYMNYTGDGIMAFCGERKNAWGKVELPALDNMAITCMDLVDITDSIAEAWKKDRKLRLFLPDGSVHETGSSFTYGDLEIGDPLVLDSEVSELYQGFNQIFRDIVMKRAPHFEPRLSQVSTIRSCNAAGTAMNKASRIQKLDREYPEYSCMTTADIVEQLSRDVKKRFERLGKHHLKGFTKKEKEKVQICGVRRDNCSEIPLLLEQSMRAYEQRPYSRSANKTRNVDSRHKKRKVN